MDDPIDRVLTGLASPIGAVILCGAVFLAILPFLAPKGRWIIFGLAIWASSLELGFDPANPERTVHLIGPLQTLCEQGRALTIGLLICLVAPAVATERNWRRKILLPAAVAFFCFELAFCLRTMLAGFAMRGFGAVATYVLTFIVVARGVACRLQQPEDILDALRSMGLAAGLFALLNSIQLLINNGAARVNGRFAGTAGNPQHAATCIACLLPAVVYLLQNKQENKLLRLAMVPTAGVMLLLLLLTGSRTGALMLLVALVILFHRWLAQFFKVALVISIAVFLLALVLPDVVFSTDRFTSTEDTRSIVWQALLQDFTQNPLVGSMTGEVGIRESSYLSAAGRLGLLGLIPLAITLILCAAAILRLLRARLILGEQRMLADLAIAGIIALLVGAMTEGFLLATIAPQILILYLYFTVVAFILDYSAAIIESNGQGQMETVLEQDYIPDMLLH